MKLFNLFNIHKRPAKFREISDFLLHAPEEEQKKLFMEAARRANEDQRETYRKAELKAKGT